MEVVNNKKQFRFEIALPDGDFARLEYRWLKGAMVLMHTFVPPSARGSGAGNALVKYVLDSAREQGLKVIVYCPFAAAWLKRHPEYDDLVEEAGKK